MCSRAETPHTCDLPNLPEVQLCFLVCAGALAKPFGVTCECISCSSCFWMFALVGGALRVAFASGLKVVKHTTKGQHGCQLAMREKQQIIVDSPKRFSPNQRCLYVGNLCWD